MPARRSGRVSGSRTRYTEDPFASAGVEGGESDVGDGAEGKSKDEGKGKGKGKGKARVENAEDIADSDEEFAAPQDDDDDDEGDEEFAGGSRASSESEGGGEDEDEPGLTALATDELSERAAPPRGQGLKKEPKTSKPKKPKQPEGRTGPDANAEQTHSRGMTNPALRPRRKVNLRLHFGAGERDLLAVVYARDRWYRGVDSTFPTRHSLNQAEVLPDYGYGLSFGVEPDDAKRERTRGWDWYYDADVGERFKKRQRLERVAEEDARRIYLPRSGGVHTVLIGPVDGQKVVELAQNEVFNFGEAWGKRRPGKEDNKVAEESKSEDKGKIREGWIMNFGEKIQGMSWAPNQPGLTQYLAVVSPITKEQKANYPDPLERKAAPAFRPSAPYPSALQMWAFRARRSENLTKTIDMHFIPRLRLALCTDWGDLRRFAWCPMARDTRDEDDEDALRSIGLLAGVWSDGVVRVIDIKITRSAEDTEFYKVQSPVFEAKPPSTICTCLSWLSPSDIAVGCADGFVAIWNIAQSPSTASPLPVFYQQIHSTYILSISSAYPTYPCHLATTSMDGATRLSSILDPQTDVTETTRMRIASSHITYSPMLQSFLCSEENDFIRLLAIRRFFSSTAIAKLPSTSSAVAPPSPWHPTVMGGSTSGTVVATNPIRRILSSRVKQWQLAWFSHEWAPKAGGTGVSRFLDGFRAEQNWLIRNSPADWRPAHGRWVVTVFPEETHVTALAWNPNQVCAGWACAGMGCGLVRVEDLAL